MEFEIEGSINNIDCSCNNLENLVIILICMRKKYIKYDQILSTSALRKIIDYGLLIID